MTTFSHLFHTMEAPHALPPTHRYYNIAGYWLLRSVNQPTLTVSLAIDQFVSQVYPKGSRYFWVIQ